MEEVLWLSGNLSNGHTDLHDWSLSVLTIKKCLIKGLCFNLVEISIRWPNSQQSPSEIVCTWDSLILWPFQNIRLEVEMWPDEWRRGGLKEKLFISFSTVILFFCKASINK